MTYDTVIPSNHSKGFKWQIGCTLSTVPKKCSKSDVGILTTVSFDEKVFAVHKA